MLDTHKGKIAEAIMGVKEDIERCYHRYAVSIDVVTFGGVKRERDGDPSADRKLKITKSKKKEIAAVIFNTLFHAPAHLSPDSAVPPSIVAEVEEIAQSLRQVPDDTVAGDMWLQHRLVDDVLPALLEQQ